MIKNVKVLFYVDMDDNTKSVFLIVDESKKLRDGKVVEKIAEELETCGFGNIDDCRHIAIDLAYNGDSEILCQMGRYEFGVEEVPMY